MEKDLWRQWQTYLEQMFPAGESPGLGQAPQWFASYGNAAERFTSEARRFFEAAQSTATPAAEAARVFGDSLREQFADFFPKLWSIDPAKFAASSAWPSMGDAPALGLTREHQLRWQRALEAGERMNAAQRRLQRLWSDVLQEAAKAFAGPLAAAARTPPNEEGLHALYDSWIDCAEQAYARAAHGEEFGAAMAEFVNAGSEWRRHLKEGAEQYAKLLDMPTRTEINSMLQRLKALEERTRVKAAPIARAKRSSSNARKNAVKKRKTAGRRRPKS
jgi:hypothetical protein